VVTNGSVRDLDMIAPGFQLLAGVIAPSHAFVHLVHFDCEVNAHGMVVRSGDLIHADKYQGLHIAFKEFPSPRAGFELCGASSAPFFRSTRQQRQSMVTPPARCAARPGIERFHCQASMAIHMDVGAARE
jgi:hypothetical protein